MDARTHPGALAGVLQRLNGSRPVDAVHEVTTTVRNERLDPHLRARQAGLHRVSQFLQTMSRAGGDHHAAGMPGPQGQQCGLIGTIRLVADQQLRHIAGADLGEHLAHRRDLPLGVRVRGVDHVKEEVSGGGFLQGGTECLHQVVGKVPDESHGVGQREHPPVPGFGAAGGGIQGGEQRVLHEYTRARQPVQQRGLARVGVADDRHAGHPVPAALGAFALPGDVHLAEPTAKLRDPVVDAAPIRFEFRFARPTAADARAACGAAAGLPGQVSAPATKTLFQVLQLGQFHLGLALRGFRMGCEDVQDQRGPVHHLHLDEVLQVSQLRRLQVPVADDGVGASDANHIGHFLNLAASDVGRGIRLAPPLHQGLQNLGASGFGQQFQLGHRVVGVLLGPGGPHGHQHHPFQPQLAVLNLGDVLQFGAHADNPPERVPLGKLDLITIVVRLCLKGCVHRRTILSGPDDNSQLQYSPRATITAGPVNQASSPSKVTVRSPPRTRTWMGPSNPLRSR